jgi:hypothetical protein
MQPDRAVVALRAAGFSDLEIAEAAGASESSVGKWRAGTQPNPDARRALDELRVLCAYLISQGIAPAGAHAWLVGRHIELDLKAPLYWIRENRFEQRVIPLAKRFCPAEPLPANVGNAELDLAALHDATESRAQELRTDSD